MFGVMLILPIHCLFVLLRLVWGHESSEDHSGTWNLKSQASYALDHFFLPTHVLINHNDLHRLILMGPNRLLVWLSLYLVYHWTFWVVLASALCGFGYEDTLFMITLLLSVYYFCLWQDHYVNWNMERPPGKTVLPQWFNGTPLAD
jgi:hypothetical protein